MTAGVVLLRPGDHGYEAARRDAVWNDRKPDRFPAAILLASCADDVVAGVRIAAAEGLRIGIRSGGHSFVGNGIRDEALLIDLSGLRAVRYDPDTGIARVEPRATGLEIQAVLARYDRFFPTGHAPTVGIGGFLLGGGYGWNSRQYGPACLSLEAIDVVLADGTLVHATDADHPDLLWAARGAGPGFFGVVTAFYLRTHPRPRRIVRTVHTYPAQLRDEVLTWSYETLAGLPAQVEPAGKVRWSPELGHHVMVTATAFLGAGDDLDVLAAVSRPPAPERALRRVVAAPTDLDELYRGSDASTPAGLRWAFDGVWTAAPVAEVLTAAAPMFDAVPTGGGGRSFVFWMLWGHYPTRPDACWSVQAPLYVSPNAGWSDPAGDLAHESWAHGRLRDLQHLSVGTQFSDNNLADRWDRCLSEENAGRLEAIRGRYDPAGLFHSFMRPEESTTAYGSALRAATA